jgi:hypothetical protein
MSNIASFPPRDLIAEMKGSDLIGSAVRVSGYEVPGIAMFDHGDEIEFIIDHRVAFGFTREQAWNALAFAFAAMAFGAGLDPLNFEPRPFAKKISILE